MKYRNLKDCIDVDDDAVKEYIAYEYNPEDIFKNEVLDRWATDNGYIKEADL
jgi:hypothetical protein